MRKHKTIIFLGAILGLLIFAGLYPYIKSFASQHSNTVHSAHYAYRVEILPDGSLAALVFPDTAEDNASAFADAYLAQSYTYLEEVAHRPTQSVDVLILFVRPLTRSQVNAILASAQAQVLESAVVGYQWGSPFAGYSIEQGPMIKRSLDEIAADFPKTHDSDLQKSGIITDIFPNPEHPIDIRGYLAARALVPSRELHTLQTHSLVRFVDVTPQIVYEKIRLAPQWEGHSIEHRQIRIEMPVWAYDW